MSQRALLITILIAMLCLALTEWTLAPVRRLIGTVVYPVSGPATNVSQSLKSIVTTVREIGTLRTDAKRLNEENQQLTAQVAELDALRHENETLRTALSFATERHDQSLIASRVVGRSPSGFLQSFELDKGEADGVAEGAPVIANGFLVGTVIRRAAHRATVGLITSSSSRVAVVTVRSRGQGILRGGLDGLVATQVPLDVHIEPGEPIVTSGLGGVIPANIPVGTAGEARSLPSSILQEIRVVSPVSFSRLELVFVGVTAR